MDMKTPDAGHRFQPSGSTTIAEELAAFATGLSWSDLPGAVVEKAKRAADRIVDVVLDLDSLDRLDPLLDTLAA